MPGGERISTIAKEAMSSSENAMLSFKTAAGALVLALTDIITCKALGKNTLLRYRSEQQRSMETVVFHLLADVEEHLSLFSLPLPTAFVRCHRSTLVNVAYCRSWMSADCGLMLQIEGMGDECVEVSRRRSKAFLEVFERVYPPVK
jgi:DNA-binding LytR/AlgR family response regulator